MPMRRFLTITVGLSLLIFTAEAPGKTLYTWTDENGITHITETPPPPKARLEDRIEYSPQSRQEIEEIRQEMKQTQAVREKERIQQLAREAQREAADAAAKAEQAQTEADAAEKRLEEFKEKINNWRRYQNNRSTILDLEAQRNAAKERALQAAEDARAAQRRAEQAKKEAEEAFAPLEGVEADEKSGGEPTAPLPLQ